MNFLGKLKSHKLYLSFSLIFSHFGFFLECVKCYKGFSDEYLYCPFCGFKSNSREKANNVINAGTGNVNIGLGINSKQDIYIDNRNLSNQEEIVVEYEDRLDREVLGGVKGYRKRYEI